MSNTKLGQAVLRRYVQSGDDQQADPYAQQYLEIESLDSGAGTFVRLATERWVVESDEEIDALANVLKLALKANVLPTNDDDPMLSCGKLKD